MNNIHLKHAKHKTTISAHRQMMLAVVMLAILSFAAGYYLAMARIAAMLVTK